MEKTKIALIFAIFFIMVVVFFLFDPVNLGGDSQGYYNIALNLINGNGYSMSATQPYKSDLNFREPVYPLVLVIGLLLFDSLYAAIIVQVLMHMATAFLIFKIAVDFMNKKYALLASTITILFPTLLNYSFHIITETTFTFFFTLSIYLLYFGLKRRKYSLMLLSSVVCGISFLTRGMIVLFPIFFAVLAAIFFLPSLKGKEGPRFTYIKHLILYVFAFLIIVFSWSGYKNFAYPGRENMNTETIDRGRLAFAVRSELANLPDKDLFVYALSVFSEKLVHIFYPEYGGDITTGRGFYYSKTIKKYGSHYADKNSAQITYETLKEHPFRFMSVAFIELIDLNMFFQLPMINANPNLKGSMYISFIRGVLKLSGLIILFFSIKGMIFVIRDKKHDIAILSLVAPVLYINSLFIVMDAIPRYSFPLIPFYLLFGVVGFYGKEVFNHNLTKR